MYHVEKQLYKKQ